MFIYFEYIICLNHIHITRVKLYDKYLKMYNYS